jgi:hypothetical protein
MGDPDRKRVQEDTLPNGLIRFAKSSRDSRRKITQDALGEALGRHVGGVGRNKSQFIATPCLEATARGCRRLWHIGVADLTRISLGPSIRNATGGNSNGAKGNEAQATAANGPCTRATGDHPPRGVPTSALATSARSRRHFAVAISVRRSDAHHWSRHRPQQSAGDGADASRRGLLAHLLA